MSLASTSTFCIALSLHIEKVETNVLEMMNSTERILADLKWKSIFLLETKGGGYNAKTPLERYAVCVANYILKAHNRAPSCWEEYLAIILHKACADYLKKNRDDLEIQRLTRVVRNYIRAKCIRVPYV